MSATCEVTLEGGLINNFVVQFDENSKAELSDSPAAERSDLARIWTARGTEPESSAIPLIQYLQFSEDGTARWAVSPDDLQIPPGSEHRGAQFDWSYADYVLTVQNQGEASEGFCKAQDVGTFLVKKVEDDGIYFWGIGDTCKFRLNTWQRAGSDWFLYVP